MTIGCTLFSRQLMSFHVTHHDTLPNCQCFWISSPALTISLMLWNPMLCSNVAICKATFMLTVHLFNIMRNNDLDKSLHDNPKSSAESTNTKSFWYSDNLLFKFIYVSCKFNMLINIFIIEIWKPIKGKSRTIHSLPN